MPVFKLCMKIIKKNLPAMSIYIVIFLAITVLMATQYTYDGNASFSGKKINMAFISTESSPLIDSFKERLSEYANFVEISEDQEALQDALYFRTVEYILRVPEGFTENIMNGDGALQLEKTTVPASASGAYIDIAIDQYFNTARLYVDGMPNITQEELATYLKEDLSYRIPVEFQDKELAEQNHSFAKNYFNYLAYSLFAVLVLGISAIMIVINNKDRKRRNACAPISLFRMNLELLLAHMCFTIVSWAIMMTFYLIMDRNNIGYIHTLYFMLNSFVFVLCASSISFFIGNLVKTQNALSAICNVVTIGPCFISGIFVPQELLGTTVLKIASFTPTYWYAKANDVISKLTSFNSTNLEPVLTALFIQLGFTVSFLTLAMVLNKKSRASA